MTSLPIVRRELQEAARRRTTYRGRVVVATSGIGIAITLIWLESIIPQFEAGRVLFWTLSALCLVYCFVVGRLTTADCISSEKRNGTLGFLFLTDLTGVDVVLGKVVATSLSGFYGLMAIFPVLALPLLLGGMTNGEFWRVVTVLISTFILSLSVGVFTSSLCRDFQRALSVNFLTLLGITCLPLVMSLAAQIRTGTAPLGGLLMLFCPGYTLYLANDSLYTVLGETFWQSVGLFNVMSLTLLGAASRIVPESWKDRPARVARSAASGAPGKAVSRTAVRAARDQPLRTRLLDRNAYLWSACRSRFKPLHVWGFLVCAAAWWIIGWLQTDEVWLDASVVFALVLILNTTLKFWIILESGHRLFEDRQAGALELLLTTPLNEHEILRGQLLALRRIFAGPLIAAVAGQSLLLLTLMDEPDSNFHLGLWLAITAMLFADILAIPFVSMHAALTVENYHRATLGTAFRLLVLPWILFGVCVSAINLWTLLFSSTGESPGWTTLLPLWLVIGIAVAILFGRRSCRLLRTQFYELATRPDFATRERMPLLRGLLKRALTGGRDAVRASTHRPERRSLHRRKRTWAVSAACIVVLAGVVLYFRHRPPAPVVHRVATQGSVQIFPADQSALIIPPDRSLWHWGLISIQPPVHAPVPQRIGMGTNWVFATGSSARFAAIRDDGTLWQWGSIGPDVHRTMTRVNGDTDWSSAAVGAAHTVALKTNGTLWAWGQNGLAQLGLKLPGTRHLAQATQVGRDDDWIAVGCDGGHRSYGIKRDGTLWTWGSVSWPPGPNTLGGNSRINAPMQFGRDTNWVGFDQHLVRNDQRELWQPMGPADATLPKEQNARFIVALAGESSFAMGIATRPAPFYGQFTSNAEGHLLARSITEGTGNPSPRFGPWEIFDDRHHWLSVHGNGRLTLGVTADDTIWAWGSDPGFPDVVSNKSRLQSLKHRLQKAIGVRGPRPRSSTEPRIQQKPRAIMRLETARDDS